MAADAMGTAGGRVSRPVALGVSEQGVAFAESVHAADFAMSVRADPFHKVAYVLRGGVRLEEERKTAMRAEVGAVVLIPAGVRHRLADEVPSTLLLLGVSERFVRGEREIAELWSAWAGAGRRVVNVARSERREFEALWRQALAERALARVAGAAATRALALQVFVRLARLPKARGADDAATRVAAVARAVEETFFESWTVDSAAERAGMSRRHFTSHFRAVTGRTFWDHLTEVRLTRAAELLRRGEHSVTGVIFACGFGDVSQFYRLFRTRFGRTPGAWAGGKSEVGGAKSEVGGRTRPG